MKKILCLVLMMISTFAFCDDNLLFEKPFGKLGVMNEEQAVDNFMMPTSIRVYGDQIMILDAPNFALRVYNLKGENTHSIILPSKTLEDKKVLYTDFYSDEFKNFVVVSPTDNSIIIVNWKGEFLKKITENPLQKKSSFQLFNTLDAFDKDKILVQDISAGKIYLIDHKGKIIRSFETQEKPVLSHDGYLYAAETRHPKINDMIVTKMGILKDDSNDFVKISFKTSCIPIPIGTDKSGNLYFHIVTGNTEIPDASFVLKLDPKGKEIYRKDIRECPNAGTIRDICVSPEGKIFYMTSNEAGIGVYTLK